jgi:phosphoribosylformimino-5-aminoimidazole carboxamide ribonucleotide (ProFAR) isomerase
VVRPRHRRVRRQRRRRPRRARHHARGTDVAKDGTLSGPNLDLLRRVCAATDRPVVASGGVASLADLHAIAQLVPIGVEGAIVGKALYAGAFTLPEALAAVAPRVEGYESPFRRGDEIPGVMP